MRSVLFALLLLASSPASADEVCISAISDPNNRPPDRDFERIVAPPPVYPNNVLAEGAEGFVDIKFEITTTGTVRDPAVIISVPPGVFDEAALQGVLKFYYKPRIVDGEPVAVEGVRTRLRFGSSAQAKTEEQKPTKQKLAKAVSKRVYDRIQLAQKHVDAEDFAGALGILQNIFQTEKLTEYEKTNVLNYVGFVQYNMDNISGAIATYEEMLRIAGLEDQIRKQTTYTLAQLNTMQEQYTNAIHVLDEWFALELNPGPEPYILYAQNLYQVERYPEMVKPIETAMLIAGRREQPIKEDWWVLLNFAYFQEDDYGKVRDIQKILLANWPKKRYWMSLAGAYSELGEIQTVLETYEEMKEHWPSEEFSHDLAWLHMGTGDKKKALALFRELLASWPETDYLTQLHLAAAEGDTTSIAELLTDGVNVNSQSDNDRTPLHWAVEFGQAEAIKVLIDANADVNAKTEKGSTPLHAAANTGDASVVEMLISAGARIDIKAENAITTFHAAVSSGERSSNCNTRVFPLGNRSSIRSVNHPSRPGSKHIIQSSDRSLGRYKTMKAQAIERSWIETIPDGVIHNTG